MPGVVGGVSPRPSGQGQAPLQYPDLLSASTTIVQSGGGGFARLINALQLLDQSGNLVSIASQLATLQADITTIQGQITTLQQQAQLFTAFQASFNYLQTEVSTGMIFLDQRTIYRRSFVISGATNVANSMVTYPHTIPAINYIVECQAVAEINSGPAFPITYLNTSLNPIPPDGISISVDPTNIYIYNGNIIRTNYLCLVTLWYTPTNR